MFCFSPINSLPFIDPPIPPMAVSGGRFVYACRALSVSHTPPARAAASISCCFPVALCETLDFFFFLKHPSEEINKIKHISDSWPPERQSTPTGCLPQSGALISSSRARGCQYDNRSEGMGRAKTLPPHLCALLVSTRPIFTQRQPWSDTN